MRRFIINILIFFAIIVCIDYGTGMLGDYLQAHSRSGLSKLTNDLVMLDCHDVIILGSSRAHHHYDTPFLSDTLGLDVYNAGYDGNGAVLAYGFLSLILDRYQPKLVIFDVEPAFDIFDYDGDNKHKRYLKNLKPYFRYNSIAEIFKDVSEEEWYKVHSGLIRYNSSLILKISDYLKEDQTDNKGYEALEGIYNNEPDMNDFKDIEIDSFKLKYIEKMILLAQTKNVPLIIVGSPKYGFMSSTTLEPVKELCAKYNVKFIDLYCDEDFMQHKIWFSDPSHLNKEGARYFSSIIINDINSIISKRQNNSMEEAKEKPYTRIINKVN